MAEPAGLGRVDGVAVVDVVALARLLEATGPVDVGGRRYTAANAEDALLDGLYRGFDGRVAARRHELARVASAVFQALDERRVRPSALAGAMADAARGRHLLLWSRAPRQAAVWRAAGAAGALDPSGVMVSVQNHGGDKLDRYLRPRLALATRSLDGREEVTLRIDLANRAPSGLPAYVSGEGRRGLPPGDYKALVTVHVPAATFDLERGDAEVIVAGRDGPMRVVGIRTVVPRGERRTIELSFSLPAGTRSLRLLPDGRAEPTTVRYDGRTLVLDRLRPVSW
jgi:hypothetical protein